MEDNKNEQLKDDSAVSSDTEKVEDNTKNETVATEKTFTQEEVDSLIQKRLDRALKKAQEEKEEAEKLAKMSEAERQKALFEKEKAEFEEERKKYQREKLELEVTKQLSSKNLPVEFGTYLLGENAEDSFNRIKNFEVKWQQALEKAINERLKGNTPKVATVSTKVDDPFLSGFDKAWK